MLELPEDDDPGPFEPLSSPGLGNVRKKNGSDKFTGKFSLPDLQKYSLLSFSGGRIDPGLIIHRKEANLPGEQYEIGQWHFHPGR